MVDVLWILPTGRCLRLGLLLGVLMTGTTVYLMWYGANSDRDDISPLLTHLIPAGHATCQLSTTFQCSSCLEQHTASVTADNSSWTFQHARDGHDDGLSEAQCDSAFPGLFEDVQLGVRHWRTREVIDEKTLDQVAMKNSMTRAMYYQGHLYVIETKSKGEDHRRKMVAVLSSIHRALAAMPASERRELQDIEFMFSVEDKATDITSVGTEPLWVLARKASEQSYFLIPDFGYWAWDNMQGDVNNEIGAYDSVVDKAIMVESNIVSKIQQLVWRGKLSFAPKLRRGLLDTARGMTWSNVKAINWHVRQNYLTLDEHCRYMFIAHVEGRSYSGSLKYRQACRSVIVIHKLQYIQHHHYLLVSDGPMQNYVEVERDFSDLITKMDYLLAHPDEAQRIADNSVATFRERYLTPAAEACYWRALLRGYGKISVPARLWVGPAGNQTKRGLRYETFVLLSSKEMLDFKAG